ncbi:hypothetical protein GCM10010121_100070 [Streptomyces brasiliensis]|uniref:Resolvase/invertase-type recombinase catalytic domain-containing protein n=1 Tax=Streptomyces brasiliensis TaxID=1954 RepID=A0A917UQ02_9ACTN|nr:hypothetical protein GCM10010121_100070 [Streptomyces brasiliensis]
MIVSYVRVSSADQNTVRQLEALLSRSTIVVTEAGILSPGPPDRARHVSHQLSLPARELHQ